MFQNFAIAVSQLAQYYALKGEHIEALPWIALALKFAPDFPWAKAYIGTYYMLAGHMDRAREYYLEEIRKNPRDGAQWVGLSRVYEYDGKPDLAIQNLEEGIRLAPDFKQLYVDAFRVMARLGNRQAAVDVLERWLQREPNDTEIRAVLKDIDNFLEREFDMQNTRDDSVKERAE